jgi:polar amino acid transport system substrate-binding protein
MLKVILLKVALLWACQSVSASVTIVTEHLPPYQIAVNGQLVGGSAYLYVKKALEQAKLDYQSEVLPWPRAYKMALEKENTIIFSMFRTSKRETLFQWIGVLTQVPFQLFIASDHPNPQALKKDPLNYVAVAVRDSAEADLLIKKGFKENDNLLLVKDYLTVWSMLKLHRADITIAHHPYQGIIDEGKMQTEDFKAIQSMSLSMPLYIAASLNTDPVIVEKLRHVLNKE